MTTTCGVRSRRLLIVVWLALFLSGIAACSRAASPLELPAAAACRASAAIAPPIRWLAPSSFDALDRNQKWCDAVGPVAFGARVRALPAERAGNLLVVSWNMAVGAGDLEHLLRTIRREETAARRDPPELIVLLQEAYRIGEAVPQTYARHAGVPKRITGGRHGRDVASLAARLDMSFVYAPSMRNGAADGKHTAEDRGNAILSTLPLEDVAVVELPFEYQRRVAVAARVTTPARKVTVASVHLDTRRPFWKGSIFAGAAGRQRQARALLNALSLVSGADPVIVAGDFNTLGGSGEPAIRSLEERFVRVRCGSPHTHQWNFQLDYLFASDPALVPECVRRDGRFESDHHPLVARLHLDVPS